MDLILRYHQPAPDTEDGWEKNSLPLGNSYTGVSVFGGAVRERLQVTENSLENTKANGGLNSAADIFFEIPYAEDEITEYERGLDIGRALAYVRFRAGGISVEREYAASYPDRTVIGSIVTDQPMSFSASLAIPFLTEEQDREKRGTVFAEGDTLTMTGIMEYYRIRFAGQLKISTDGTISAHENTLDIQNAKQTTFRFCFATNYILSPEVFLEEDPKKKLRDFDPLPIVRALLASASEKSYEVLKARHLADYQALFGRVSLNLGETDVPALMTDELLSAYQKGERSRYLEVLYIQYGRYLLIASSRKGALPANLQGVWNCHDRSPWGSGYWHNINVQMNYWPAFIMGIPETFQAYEDYNLAFRPQAEHNAEAYISEVIPEHAADRPHESGWTIGTAAYPYTITAPGAHSGPGTGGLTTKLFWERYAFTNDRKALREVTYPALFSMAKFLCRTVKDYDGKALASFSASPEQCAPNPETGEMQYYQTVGCAFDQQLIWENAHDLLKCAELLGEDTLSEEDRVFLSEVRRQIGRYDPVQVGWSGQIREFREEHFYGEIGEFRHRHISQLMGLYPGTLITRETPAWLDAAKVSLTLRSDESTGWALAHRLNAWARTGDGNHAYKLFSNLIALRTYPNLWDCHAPFQIDGNFGGTSGAAELLLQSHGTYLAPLASLPDVWDHGSYQGICARGGFSFDVSWQHGCADRMTVHAASDGICRIFYPNIGSAVYDFAKETVDRDHIIFDAVSGGVYHITNIPAYEKQKIPTGLRADHSLHLMWDAETPVDIYRAADSEPCYQQIASGITDTAYQDDFDFASVETLTYKVTAAGAGASAAGATLTLNHATAEERTSYLSYLRENHLISGDTVPYLGE